MKYYFCYSENIMKKCKAEGIRYITEAKHIKTDKVFWLYERSQELDEVLNEWSLNK